MKKLDVVQEFRNAKGLHYIKIVYFPQNIYFGRRKRIVFLNPEM